MGTAWQGNKRVFSSLLQPLLCPVLQWDSVPPSQHDTRHPLLGGESLLCVSSDAERGRSFQPPGLQEELQAWGRVRTSFAARWRRLVHSEF